MDFHINLYCRLDLLYVINITFNNTIKFSYLLYLINTITDALREKYSFMYYDFQFYLSENATISPRKIMSPNPMIL